MLHVLHVNTNLPALLEKSMIYWWSRRDIVELDSFDLKNNTLQFKIIL